MENENNFKKTNEAYKLTPLDWVRWAFDLVVFFAERWDEIPKPRSRAKGNSQVSVSEIEAEGNSDGADKNNNGASVA